MNKTFDSEIFWQFIIDCGWSKTVKWDKEPKIEAIQAYLAKCYSRATIEVMRGEAEILAEALETKVLPYLEEFEETISRDHLRDTAWHLVGLGREAYESAFSNQELFREYFKGYRGRVCESFSYVFDSIGS